MDDLTSQFENRSVSSCVPFWDILGSFPFLLFLVSGSGEDPVCTSVQLSSAAASGFRNSMTFVSGLSSSIRTDGGVVA